MSKLNKEEKLLDVDRATTLTEVAIAYNRGASSIELLLLKDAEMADVPPTAAEIAAEDGVEVTTASVSKIFKKLIDLIVSLFKRNKNKDKDKPDGDTGDEVDFSQFKFTFGGEDARNAQIKPGARIQHLSSHATGMSYSWAEGGCELFGAKNASDANSTICAWFVKRSDGQWVGGKFDWISTNRLTRGFKGHVVPDGSGATYGGWSLSGVPNPCDAAFVIINRSGSLRTNVIAGTWTR